MFRKTIFIAVVVTLVFLIYRGISPTGADKMIDKLSSIREKNISNTETGNINTGNTISSGNLISGDNSFDKLIQSGAIIGLTGDQTKSISTGDTNTGGTTGKTISTNPTTQVKVTPTPTATTNTNGLSQQDLNDLKELLNNIVE